MPTLAQLHPQVVHFAVALMLVGVLFRLVSLTGRLRFTNHAAAVLILMGTVATIVAVKSGDAAHGPVERIPGVRPMVIEHEEAAEWVERIFLGLLVIEATALGLSVSARTQRFVRGAHIAAAVVGVWGSVALVRTAHLGGELVYNYAGGPGLRSGEDADVSRLLLAGLHAQAQVDRREKRSEDAARLVDEMARRFPTDTTVQFLRAESLLRDRAQPADAMAALNGIGVRSDDARLAPRRALLAAEIWVAMGQPDAAKTELDAAIAAFPQNARLKARRDSLP
ncbi:MAG: hypothetical protein C0503_08255 [Gemmatimonas sp.]|nr:hypothetical protein [Gemmatimonas sp.]